MTCREIQGVLPGYLDDALSEFNRKIVAGHVATCPFCRETLADLTRAREHLQALRDIDPPYWLRDSIMQQVRAEASVNKWRSLLRRLFYPLEIKIPLQAMATVAVAVVAIYLFRVNAPEMGLPSAPQQALKQETASQSLSTAPQEDVASQAGDLLLSAPPAQKEQETPVLAEEKTGIKAAARHGKSFSQPSPVVVRRTQPSESMQAAPGAERLNAPEAKPDAGRKDEIPANISEQSVQQSPVQSFAVGEDIGRAEAESSSALDMAVSRGGVSAKKSLVLSEKEPAVAPVELTLRVADISQALTALEKICKEFEASFDELEHSENIAVVRITLKSGQTDKLIAELAGLGEPLNPLPGAVPEVDALTVRLQEIVD